jgi:hypothetical protein
MPHVCTIQQLTMHNKAPRFDRIRTVCIYIYVCACCQLIPHSEALDFFFGIYHLKKQRAYVSSVTVHTHRECISITAMHVPDRRREQHLITALHAGRFLIWRNRKKYFTHDIFYFCSSASYCTSDFCCEEQLLLWAHVQIGPRI